MVPSVTYGTEAAVEHPHRRARVGVRAELGERRLRPRPAAALGLGEDRLGLGERHGEELVLGLEAAAVGALLEVGPVATVLRGDLVAVGVGADDPRQREQLRAPPRASTVSGSIDANSDARGGFAFEPSSSSPSCTNGPKRPLSASTFSPVVGIGAELAGAGRALGEQLLGRARR